MLRCYVSLVFDLFVSLSQANTQIDKHLTMATEGELNKIWKKTEELMKCDGGDDTKSFRM